MKTIILLSLALLTACGNPHLNKIEGLGTTNVPVIGTPEDLSSHGIRMDDGLSLKTETESISGLVDIQNMDLTQVWSLKFEFEKGEHFQFNGTSFPGKAGTCSEEIKGKENCKIDILFHSKTVGLFADNLKVTYSTVDKPDEVKVITYPLRGERTPKVTESVSVVTIKTLSQVDHLDFGKSLVDDEVTGIVVVKNEGEVDVNFDVTLDTTDQINFRGKDYPGKDGTCGKELKVGKKCQLDMAFNSSKEGLFQSNIVLVHSPADGTKKTTVKFAIIGEKTPKKKQGPLVSSEVFGSTVDFGKVKLGVEVKKQIEIQNLGETVYGLKEALLSNKEVFNFSGGKYPGLTGTCGDVLLPGSCLIELTYKPNKVKKDSGTFKLNTKEGDSVELKLLGEGAEDRKCESYNEYLIVPEKTYPATSVIFPYLKTHSSTSAKLSQLYGLEVNGYVKELDNYVVKDGMVYVTYKMPKMTGEIVNMNFGVHVLKVIQDNFKDTESLCLSTKGVRKCSGHQFSLASWQALRNPKFWDKYATPVSERYEKQFANGEKQCGSYRCMNLNTQYELSDIFELSAEEMKSVREEGTFTLIFSDDTRMLKMPRIAVKTKVVVSCE